MKLNRLPIPFVMLAILALLAALWAGLMRLGWLTQLIFGSVFWMFPIYSSEKPRGDEMLGWLTYASLNAGLLLRAVAEPFNSPQPGQVWGWFLVVSAVLQWLAGAMFMMNTWQRVREK